MNEQIENFCYYYDAQIKLTGNRFRRPVWKIINHANPSDTVASTHFPIEDIPMLEIVMPEDRFRHLVEMRGRWNDTIQRSYHTNDVSKIIWEQYEKESRLRHQHPALQDLWQQYQEMLALVDDGR